MHDTCLVQGSQFHLNMQQGQLLVMDKQEAVGCYPLESLKHLVIFGNPQVTTQAIKGCLAAGVDIQYYSQFGKFLGMFEPHESKNTERRLAHYALVSDETRRLAWGKAVLEAKLHSCALEYRRFRDNGWCEGERGFPSELRGYSQQLSSCRTLLELMGVEGQASRRYYSMFGSCLPSGWNWSGRHYHPCTDAVNALLSLTYALVTGRLESLCRQHGLLPELSFLHRSGYGSGGLATDLVEPLRASVCDHLVLKAIRSGLVTAGSFVMDSTDGMYLQERAFRIYMTHYRVKVESGVEKLCEKLVSFVVTGLKEPGEVPDFCSLLPRR